ncbi:endocuticle structural glycoprotein SgAbd-5-like [Anastrepha obliqua]|uniref:endocuticle structural glycoprotein SgAbd-5-like n=1 Tax=Anastrepha obliqua TaxID=95512 RepID=UPI0024095408|nr:endocuticle structural glycoprotein SgAbd-5-like [Anastrepha obliqua]XP_054735079.1 endocuticle structural glycoprotein SgAbd-5-like [Anastrepha obliqua]
MTRLFVFVAVLYIGACVTNANPVPDSTPTKTTHSDDDVQIVNFSNDNVGANGYNFAFETSDGVSRKEMATVKNAGSISVEGTVSWTGPDGVQYTLNYVADEHGFQPQGAHLPVGPEPAT